MLNNIINIILNANNSVIQFSRKYSMELVGVPLIGIATVFALGLVLSAIPIANKFSDRLCLFPPWPAAIVAGALICVLKNLEGPTRPCLFTWVLPAGYFLAALASALTSPPSTHAWQGWTDMVAHKCDGEDCFDPMLACIPLTFSLSYSATAGVLWLIKHQVRNRRNRETDRTLS